MRLLVSGGAGFIASHLIEFYLNTPDKTDLKVTILDRLDSTVSLRRLTSIPNWDDLKQYINFVYWDLKSPINFYTIKEIGSVDYIIHTAASSHVDRSIIDPLSFVMDNVVGTCNILNFSIMAKPKKFIYLSTDECMGSAPDGISYTELLPTHPENPYSAAKCGGESLVIAYACTYNLNALIVRLMNVYGTKQNYEKFIPLTIRKILLGEKITIHADSSRTISGARTYIHTDDVISAIEFVRRATYPQVPTISKRNYELGKDFFNEGGYNGTYHVVGPKEVSNLELASTIAKIMKRPFTFELVDYHSSRPEHDLIYRLDGTKLKKLGWEPSILIDDKLEEVVNWYLDRPDWLGL